MLFVGVWNVCEEDYIEGIAKELFLSHLLNNKLALKVLYLKTHVANKVMSSNQLHGLTWLTSFEVTPCTL